MKLGFALCARLKLIRVCFLPSHVVDKWSQGLSLRMMRRRG